MSLVAQITKLAERVAEQFAAIAGRLIPTGGTTGQILLKTDDAAGFAWVTPAYLEDAPNDGKMYVRQNGTWVEYGTSTNPNDPNVGIGA